MKMTQNISHNVYLFRLGLENDIESGSTSEYAFQSTLFLQSGIELAFFFRRVDKTRKKK